MNPWPVALDMPGVCNDLGSKGQDGQQRYGSSRVCKSTVCSAPPAPGSVRLVRLACGLKHTLFLSAAGELPEPWSVGFGFNMYR